MKTRDKVKKKLKVRKWLNENNGGLCLAVIIPLLILNGVLLFVNPLIAIICLGAAFGVGVIGGIEILFRDNKNIEKVEELTKDLDALTGASKETVVEIQKEIEQTKEKPLVKALIRRKKLVEKELKEKEIAYSNGVNSVEIGLD